MIHIRKQNDRAEIGNKMRKHPGRPEVYDSLAYRHRRTAKSVAYLN
jgi:hypothetical protein